MQKLIQFLKKFRDFLIFFVLQVFVLTLFVKSKDYHSSRMTNTSSSVVGWFVEKKHNITKHEADYFVFTGTMTNQAYDMQNDTINILTKKGRVVDVAKASDQLNIEALSKKVVKHYFCFPKGLE